MTASRRSLDIFTFSLLALLVGTMLLAVIGTGNALVVVLSASVAPVFLLELESGASAGRARRERSAYLAFPVLLSACQNVYLGLLMPSLAEQQVQPLLILNFLVAAGLAVAAWVGPDPLPQAARTATLILASTFALCLVATALFGSDPMAALTAMRNLLNPALFFFVGAAFAASVFLERFLTYIAWIAAGVLAFGVLELWVAPTLWQDTLHVERLWEAKDLPLGWGGIPANFYSSEMIGGEQLRRMVSGFADPVNLGSFLFCAFMACWYLRWRVLAVIVVLGAVVTISKGALLGLLIFWVFRARYKSPEAYALTAFAALAVGVAFVVYSLTHSTQSLAAHVSGLTTAFGQLPSEPLGHGLGNVGIRASIEAGGAGEITESGLGVVAGQLGVLGLALFAWLFMTIANGLRGLDGRRAVLGYSLLVGITANIAFNEVALSPNSSAAYFLILGILAASPEGRRPAAADEPATAEPPRSAIAS